MTNARLIADELSDLLQRTNEDAFLILTEPASGKFVQFTGRRGDPLFLDLPCQTLSDAEFRRATELFRTLGQELQEYDLLDAPGGKSAGRQRSFQITLGRDVPRATEITLAIFRDVYGSSENVALEPERN